MICKRCIMIVEELFRQVGAERVSVSLGEVKILNGGLSEEKLAKLDVLLTKFGFERIDDKRSRLVEQIKATIISAIHDHNHFDLDINWSEYLSEQLHYDYNHLSSVFSTHTGIPLAQYIIRQKIEKVKEYLLYDEIPLKEIAFQMGYSSVAYLSSQFRKVTGLTLSEFRTNKYMSSRKPVDHII